MDTGQAGADGALSGMSFIVQWWHHHDFFPPWMPAWALGRIAKVIQFVSGSVVVVQIIGEERFQQWADAWRIKAEELAARRIIRPIALYGFAVSWDLTRNIVRSLRCRGKGFTRDYTLSKSIGPAKLRRLFPITVYIIMGLLSISLSAPWVAVSIATLPFSILGFCFGAILVMACGILPALILSPVVAILLWLSFAVLVAVLLWPMEWLLDKTVGFLVNYLKKAKASAALTLLSFVMLVLGFFLDMLAS
ncbi:MAG: hypothetical protein V4671_29930 [Armatimonadota bacterium]